MLRGIFDKETRKKRLAVVGAAMELRARLGLCRAALKWVFLNLWAGQWLGRNKAFYGPLF